MIKKPYLPRKESERVIWLNNFASKIGGYGPTFNITAGEIIVIVAMALIYSYIINLIEQSRTYTKKLTSFKNLLSFAPSGATLGTLPVLAPGVAPALTQAGIFTFISGIAQRIKGNTANYNAGVGNDLGIIGDETVFVPDDFKPAITCKSLPGYVKVDFLMHDIEAMEIFSNPVGGSDPTVWEKIATVHHSGFHDIRPLAVAGKPETRTYKARGILHDAEIGLFSDPAVVTFAG